MEELFSCRNCVHNSGQSLNAGPGKGYCQFHSSVIDAPSVTTCKYLHRKDLPRFAVEEGIREHAYEFTMYPGLVNLATKEPIGVTHYSEKFAWEHGQFNPLLNALAQYYKAERSWVFIQAFTGGVDGMRSLAHVSLVRRYMDRCAKWTSSYRLVLSMVQEIDIEPQFEDRDLITSKSLGVEEARAQALWDVIFARISGLQEYGWHSGLEYLVWITDNLNGALSEFDWGKLKPQLTSTKPNITNLIINHAQENGEFFAHYPERESESESDSY